MALTKISTDGVKDDAVTAGKIPANAVGSSELADNAVDTAAIADDAVTQAKLADSSVITATLGNGVVNASKIADNSITTGKLTTAAKNAEDGLVKYLRTGAGTDAVQFTIITPDGSTVNTSGTTTEGLQEAINYANNNGFDFYCAGGGIEADGTATDVGVISCSTTLQIPACQNRSFVFKSVTLNFDKNQTGGMRTDAGLKFDSFMMMDFDFAGQVGYHGTGNAVEFDPVNNVPLDGSPAQVDSRIKIDTIAYIQHGIEGDTGVAAGTSPDCSCVKLARTSGGAQVSRNHFFFGEINGSGFSNPTVTLHARNGISIAHQGVFGNIFDISGIHHVTEAGILMGYATNVPGPYGNTFRVGLIEPFKKESSDANIAFGLKSYGNRNDYNFAITNNGGGAMGSRYGSFSHAVKFESNALLENVFLRRSEGASSGFVNNDTTNDNIVNHDGALIHGFALIGTTQKSVFNGAGGNSKMVVVGLDTATNVVNNVNSSITIANSDGTADNLAGLHFAREDNDGSPHYCGASVVAQFREAQADSTYPSADLNFLTSHAHGNAPRLSATIHRAGYFTTPYVPWFRVDGPDSNANYTGTITWTNAIENPGGHFKTTTGTGQMQRFIAPVAGHYLFSLGFFPNGAASFRVELQVNGSAKVDPYITGGFSSWGTGAPAPSGTQVLKLSANDYVTVSVNGTMTNTYGGHTGWQGILLS